MTEKKPKSWWNRLSAKHKKKYKLLIGFIAALGTMGSTYKTWSPYIHEWFTPEFSIEVHQAWTYDGAIPSMTTPFHSSKMDTCGDDPFDEILYAEVRNNHAHPATLRTITISVKDWAGWHLGTNIESTTPLVFLPDRNQCEPSALEGTGCYWVLGDNREYRLDSALPRITLPPGQVVTGYFELKWDSIVAPTKISAYRAVTIDADGETSTTEIDPPTAPSHKHDEPYIANHRHQIGWKPDCSKVPLDASR